MSKKGQNFLSRQPVNNHPGQGIDSRFQPSKIIVGHQFPLQTMDAAEQHEYQPFQFLLIQKAIDFGEGQITNKMSY